MSQLKRVTFSKTKALPSEETSKAISQSTTSESPLHTESIIGNRKIHHVADFISNSYGSKRKHNVESLNKDEKYQYLVKSKKCFDAETLITKSYTKSNKTCNLLYKKSWLDQYSWHVYSPHLNGGLCNVCVLYDDPDVKIDVYLSKKLSKIFQNRKK